MGDTGNREYTVFSTRYWTLRTFMIIALIIMFESHSLLHALFYWSAFFSFRFVEA